MKAAMKTPVIFDGRNLYEPQAMQSSGVAYMAYMAYVAYVAIGR